MGTGRLIKLLKRHWRDGLPAPWSYVFAVVCIGIAILIRSSLDWIEGDVPTFAANFPAIVLATLLGGFGPGLVAAILSTLVRGLMLAGHAHGLAHLGATHVVDLVFYFGCCALAVWFVHNYRVMLFQLRRQEQHIKLLMRELQHRRRNAFAVVQAIVARTLSHDRDAAKRINDRINALLSADKYLMNAEGQSATRGGLHRQRLHGHDHRVPGIGRHDRRSNVEAGHLPPDHGQSCESVDVEQLGGPEIQAVSMRGPRRLNQFVYRVVAPTAYRYVDPDFHTGMVGRAPPA